MLKNKEPRVGAAVLALLACHFGMTQRCRADEYDSSHAIPGIFYNVMLSKGRVTEALARNDRQLARDPNNGNLHLDRSEILLQQGYPGAAAEEVRKVMRMRSDAGYLHAVLAWDLLVGGQPGPAADEFLITLKMQRPVNAAAVYALLSLALEKLHANADAVSTLGIAFKLSDREVDYDFLAIRCNVAAQIGLLDSAAEACDASLSQHPRNAYARFGRGLLHLKTKQWAQAIEDYGKALYLDPESAMALFARSLAETATANAAAAAADRQAALREEPAMAEIFWRAYGLR